MNKLIPLCFIIFLFIIVINLTNCSFFEQNKFVKSETIFKSPKEQIFYKVYQTGIDNYTYEFLVSYGTDTIKLFEYYLNDAVHTVMKFNVFSNNDTIRIKTNMPTNNLSAITNNNTIVILTNE